MQQIFCGLDGEVWKPPCVFAIPQHEKKIPDFKVQPSPNMAGIVIELPAAYLLLNTEIGAESEVVRALKRVEGVETAFYLWGVYDVIASVKADTMDKLSFIINREIDKISKIHSKLTMIVSEQPRSSPTPKNGVFS